MLIDNGYCLSTHFKTVNAFGHQPIIVSNETLKALLRSYVTNVRNRLIGKSYNLHYIYYKRIN
jgi:hypothetical protein